MFNREESELAAASSPFRRENADMLGGDGVDTGADD